jgi:hypothetical protein
MGELKKKLAVAGTTPKSKGSLKRLIRCPEGRYTLHVVLQGGGIDRGEYRSLRVECFLSLELNDAVLTVPV